MSLARLFGLMTFVSIDQKQVLLARMLMTHDFDNVFQQLDVFECVRIGIVYHRCPVSTPDAK